MEGSWSRAFFEGIVIPGAKVNRVVCDIPGTVHIVLTIATGYNAESLLQKYKNICELHKPVGHECLISVEDLGE